MFCVAGKDGIEHEVVQVSMLSGEVVVKIDKVLNVVMGANISHLLKKKNIV